MCREKARRKLIGLAREAGLSQRQNYNRLAPRLAGQVGRYAHTRQFEKMRKALRRLEGYTGRVRRDIERQLHKVPEDVLRTSHEVQRTATQVTRSLAGYLILALTQAVRAFIATPLEECR